MIVIHISARAEDLAEMRTKYFNRITNTLEPSKWPVWLQGLDECIETVVNHPNTSSAAVTDVGVIVTVVKENATVKD